MWVEILTAVSLLLVIEGLIPFMNPQGFKRGMQLVAQLPDRHLRTIGFASMLVGVVLLYWVR
jgi:uncharacterized protein YjeT (DUF2065 family)